MQLTFKTISVSVVFVLFSSIYAYSQPYSLKLHITNQPDNPVVLGWISGDDFHEIDSAKVFNNSATFTFPEESRPGVYRLIFGKTRYAQVMDEDPQTLDFIFNNENIELQTDFKKPVEALKVIRSDENQVYFDFITRKNEYQKALSFMEKELDLLWNKSDTSGATQLANEFNQLQMEWDLRVVQTMQQNDNKFASKLIGFERQALRDGFLSPEERNESHKNDFLKPLDFSNEDLIRSAAYTDKIFDFLVLFNDPLFTQEQRVNAYSKAVDQVLQETAENPKVSEFIRNYLIHGFEVLEMPELVQHIKNHN